MSDVVNQMRHIQMLHHLNHARVLSYACKPPLGHKRRNQLLLRRSFTHHMLRDLVLQVSGTQTSRYTGSLNELHTFAHPHTPWRCTFSVREA